MLMYFRPPFHTIVVVVAMVVVAQLAKVSICDRNGLMIISLARAEREMNGMVLGIILTNICLRRRYSPLTFTVIVKEPLPPLPTPISPPRHPRRNLSIVVYLSVSVMGKNRS